MQTPIRPTIRLLIAPALFLGALACRSAERTDDFSGNDWRASNTKAPAVVDSAPGRLILRDLPRGEVTWGSSAAKRFPAVNIEETPYLVVHLARLTGSFQIKLSGSEKWTKKSVYRGSRIGPVVVDIPKATGWPAGTAPLTIMIYTLGDATEIELNSLKLTDTLTEEEKNSLEQAGREGPAHLEQAGLDALAARTGAKPFDADPAEGERTIYNDPLTQHTVWRMTDHPAIERHVYYDILAWNADGSLLTWLSRRPGGTYWLMEADGTGIRPLPQPADGGPLKAPHWSPRDPDLMTFARPGETHTRIMSINVHDGAVTEIAAVPFGVRIGDRVFSEFPPPHPDERRYLLRWGGQDRLNTFLVVVDAHTGKHWELEPGMPTHRVRFTKHPDGSVFINSNTDPDTPGVRNRTEWVLGLDGSKRRLPIGGGHPDWSPDGAWFGVFKDGGVWICSYDGQTARELVNLQAGGHGGFSITSGAYHVADAPASGPFGNTVFVTDLAGGAAQRIAYHGSSYSGWNSGVPDPEATHPAPICSPDETKIVYDSDMLGQPDVYVAVWKRPDTPREVTLDKGLLRWQPPERHREIGAYAIYAQEDGDWRLLTTVAAPPWPVPRQGSYAVAAREWCGLESAPVVADTGALTVDALAPTPPSRPTVTTAGPTHIRLEWTASEPAGIAHYNVYRTADRNRQPGRDSLAGSPAGTAFTDWGLPADTAFVYRVTAVDWQGNESLPSPPTPGQTLDIDTAPFTAFIEAESGAIGPPMTVQHDSEASGSAYVHVPEDTSDDPYVLGGTVTIRFRVPGNGIYTVWARVQGLGGGSNSFFHSLNGHGLTEWPVRVLARDSNTLNWQRVPGLDGVALASGEHVLVIHSREDGTRLDALALTNQLDAAPPFVADGRAGK